MSDDRDFLITVSGIVINTIEHGWLTPESSAAYLRDRRCCFNCTHGEFGQNGTDYRCTRFDFSGRVGITGICREYEE